MDFNHTQPYRWISQPQRFPGQQQGGDKRSACDPRPTPLSTRTAEINHTQATLSPIVQGLRYCYRQMQSAWGG